VFLLRLVCDTLNEVAIQFKSRVVIRDDVKESARTTARGEKGAISE
jgi:hypothetical protein